MQEDPATELPPDRWLDQDDYLAMPQPVRSRLRRRVSELISRRRRYDDRLFEHPLRHLDEVVHFARRILRSYPPDAEIIVVGESLSTLAFIQSLIAAHRIVHLPFTGSYYSKRHEPNEEKRARWIGKLAAFRELLARHAVSPEEIIRRHDAGRKTIIVDFVYHGRGLHAFLDLLLETADDQARLKQALEVHAVTFGTTYQQEHARRYFDGQPFADALRERLHGLPLKLYPVEQLGYRFTIRAWTDHMWEDRCVTEYNVAKRDASPRTIHHPPTLSNCNLIRFAVLDHLFGPAPSVTTRTTTMSSDYPKYNIAFVHGAIGQFKQLHLHLNATGLANAYTLCAPGTYNANREEIGNLRVYGTVKQHVEKQFFYITKIDDVTRKAFGVKEAIEKLMAETRLDLIVAHVSGGPPLMLFDEIDVPVISYVEFPSFKAHGWDPKYPPPDAFRFRDKLMEMYYHHCCHKSDHIITPSAYAKRMLPAEFQHKATPIMEGFSLRPPSHRVEIEKEPGKTYIGFTARDLSSAKGFEQFILIAKAILKRRTNVKFVVIGSPKVLYSYEGATLDKLFGEKHGKSFKDYLWEREGIDGELGEFFEFFDFMEYDKYSAYIDLMDVYLYPLQFGSANWGLYELFCRGKLIIGSDRCYVPELITHEIDGFICDYDDIDQWVETAVRIIDDPDRLECMRRNIRINAAKYHIDNVARQYLEVFHRTITARRR